MEITKEFVESNKGKRFNIKLADGTTLKNIGFFVTKHDVICYMTSKQSRNGYHLPTWWIIESITKVKKEKPSAPKNAQKILNRLHPNAWDNLQEEYKNIVEGGEISNDFKYHFMGHLKFRNIKLFFKHDRGTLMRLQEAFESKTEFTWTRSARGRQGRDLSIETKLCDDGIFRAWFSSEFPGCGNGDYYLLLNPTTAIYYERD